MSLYKSNRAGLYPSHCGLSKRSINENTLNVILDIILIKLKHPELYSTIRNDINIVKHFLERTENFHYGCSENFLNLSEKNGNTARVEHAYTCNEEVQDLVKLNINNRENLLNHIKTNYAICLITKEEDDLLRKNKYTKTRPGGWRKCYEECGIEIIINPGNNVNN